MLPPLPLSLPASLQAFSPAQARLCLHAAAYIQETLGLRLQNKHILIGFSGGPDSLALLLILRALAPSLGISLTAAHLDHQLRKESTQEAQWCLQLCQQAAIPLYTEAVDVNALKLQQATGVEEAARIARYAFYERAAAAVGSHWLALGHHANDLAEDIMMRLIRGTGWPALAGMVGVCAKRRLFRPLLRFPKDALTQFLTSLGIQPLEDASNQHHDYLRNRVRLTLLPLLQQENPRFLHHMHALWHMGQLDTAYFAHTLEPFSPQKPASDKAEQTTEISVLKKLHKALRLRIWKQHVEEYGGQAQNTAIYALDAAIFGKQFPKTILFPGGVQVLVYNNHLVWQKRL